MFLKLSYFISVCTLSSKKRKGECRKLRIILMKNFPQRKRFQRWLAMKKARILTSLLIILAVESERVSKAMTEICAFYALRVNEFRALMWSWVARTQRLVPFMTQAEQCHCDAWITFAVGFCLSVILDSSGTLGMSNMKIACFIPLFSTNICAKDDFWGIHFLRIVWRWWVFFFKLSEQVMGCFPKKDKCWNLWQIHCFMNLILQYACIYRESWYAYIQYNTRKYKIKKIWFKRKKLYLLFDTFVTEYF